jgi:hypothetical protein
VNSTACAYGIPDGFGIGGVQDAYDRAHEAVVRLDERARRSDLRDTWMQRVLFAEACAAQLSEGDLVHLEDLVLLDGYAYSGAPCMALSSALEILNAWRAASRAEAGEALKEPRPGLIGCAALPTTAAEAADEDSPLCHLPRLERWRRVQEETRGLPPLLAAAVAWDAWLALRPETRSAWRATLLAALTLRARGLTRNLLLPVDAGWRFAKYRPHPDHDFGMRISGFLSWVEAAARFGQKEFDSLAIGERLLRSELEKRRSNSHVPRLIELLLARPFVSVPLAAKALRVSRQAAHTMLKQLGSPVHKLTDRLRYNAWTIME